MDSDDVNKQDESEADSDDDSEESEDDDELNEKMTVEDVLNQAQQRQQYAEGLEPVKLMICCVCLGDRSDATNEIVECDGCGVTVHEGCYGVSENDSVSSTVSSCSTMPWFCEACRAGVDNPTCELCPNPGGIFKETDVGKWVHLVCALYIPGVAFGEVDKLASVTLFEMAYSKWGAKSCQFCPDQRFTRTGVAIGCDAGMCRTFFHVTCGQREGLLSEAHSEEVDQADPFYAHCKLHSDKTLMRKRRRNWLALQLRTAQRKKEYESEGHNALPEQQRIQRKLGKYRSKYATGKVTKPTPWVPTQKMARLLTSSASACRALWRKAELSGVDTEAWALREAQAAALADVHRKWHIPPAFSVEFIGYYLDRNVRMETMRRQLAELLDENAKLRDDQQSLQIAYDEINKENTLEVASNTKLKAAAQKYHELILNVAPNKKLPSLETLGKPVNPTPVVLPASHPRHPLATSSGGVPTAAALKAGVGFPLGLRRQEAGPLGLNNECGICHRTTDQHLLAKCDTCHLYYHLGCLNPPLTRMPKKTKLMGWQCSECDKESSGSEVECIDPEAPRKLRNPKESNGETSVSKGPVTPTSVAPPANFPENEADTTMETLEEQLSSPGDHSGRSNKKRRREKHHRYSPEPSGSSQIARPHKRKRKRKTQDNPEEGEHRPALKICRPDPSILIHSNAGIILPDSQLSSPKTLSNNRSKIGLDLTNRCISSDQNLPDSRQKIPVQCPTSDHSRQSSHQNSPVHCLLSKNQPDNYSPLSKSLSTRDRSLLVRHPKSDQTVHDRQSSFTLSQSNKFSSCSKTLSNRISLLKKSLSYNPSVLGKRLLDNQSSPNQNIPDRQSLLKQSLPINQSVVGKNMADNHSLHGQNLPNSQFLLNRSLPDEHTLFGQGLSNNHSIHSQNLRNNRSSRTQSLPNRSSSLGQNIAENSSSLDHNPRDHVSDNQSVRGKSRLDNQSLLNQNIPDRRSLLKQSLPVNQSVVGKNVADNNSLHGQNLPDCQFFLNQSSPDDNSLLGQGLSNNRSIHSQSLHNNHSTHTQSLPNHSSSLGQNISENSSSLGQNISENSSSLDHNPPDHVPATPGQNQPGQIHHSPADRYPSLGHCLNSMFYPPSPYSMPYPAPYNLHPEHLNHISNISHCLNSFLLGASTFPQHYPAPGPTPYGMFKSIPHPTGEGNAYVATPGGGVYQASTPRPMFVTSQPSVPRVQAATQRPPVQPVPRITSPSAPIVTVQPRVSTGASKKPKESDKPIICDTCNTLGTNANLVRCDECMKGFHFACLDPPVKKSPKVRGYSWHCANCDPTESDSS